MSTYKIYCNKKISINNYYSNEAKILLISIFSQHDCLLGSHNTSVDYEMPFDLTILILYKLIVIVTRHNLNIL